jgi:hypothetical protein
LTEITLRNQKKEIRREEKRREEKRREEKRREEERRGEERRGENRTEQNRTEQKRKEKRRGYACILKIRKCGLAFANTVMNFWAPLNKENFMTREAIFLELSRSKSRI